VLKETAMLRRVIFILVLACSLQVFATGVVSRSEARDLTDVLAERLDIFLSPSGEHIPLGPIISPTLAASIAQAVTQEIPLASIAPAFTYRYNPQVDIFERATNVPGPLFAERALTLGKGQFNFGVGYAFIDFDQLNGKDLDNLRARAPQLSFTDLEAIPYNGVLPGVPPLETGQSLYAVPFDYSTWRIGLELKVHVISPTIRYGLTDRWDVGLTVPIVNTFLKVRNEGVPVVDAPGYRLVYVGNAQRAPVGYSAFIDPGGSLVTDQQLPLIKSQRRIISTRGAGSATGVGDITLRTKFHFWKPEEGGAALGLLLQLPSGEKRNFHGVGETHVSPFLYLSQVIGKKLEPHLNVGIDFNADDVDRSSFLYAVGATLLVTKSLGAVIDFIGRSEFAGIPVRFPDPILRGNLLNRNPETCTATRPCRLKPSVADPTQPETVLLPFFPEKIKRNDIINFSLGLRYMLGESGSLFFGGIVPLNDDGFRSDFIPTGGIEYTF
jgi:hypothetical protein